MKILIFAQSLVRRAGIERMTVDLANLLSESHDVEIGLIEEFNEQNSPYTINNTITVFSLKSSFNDPNIGNIRKLRKYIKLKSFELIITVTTPLVRITAPAIIGMNIHNIAWEHFNLYAGSRIGRLWKILSTYLVNKTVVLTEEDANNFRSNKARNIVVIPNFTNIHKYNPSKLSSKILLAVGRHSHQKGFDMLLKAWSKAQNHNWKLKIVGSGDLLQEHIKLAQKLRVDTSVIFVENTSNIVEEYQNASCFILSSRYEGLVMVLIEAKMMGLPCISFDCPTGPREIIQDKIDGFLVNNGDVDAMASMITEVLSKKDLSTYGLFAREDAIKRYGPKIALQKWERILNI